MPDHHQGPFPLSRRRFVQGVGATAAAAGLTAEVGGALAASSRAKTLVVAAPATPLSLDVENSLSLGSIDTVAAFYDYLIAFDMQPDASVPGAMRENLAPNPSAPGGWATTSRASLRNPSSSRPTARPHGSTCARVWSATTAIR